MYITSYQHCHLWNTDLERYYFGVHSEADCTRINIVIILNCHSTNRNRGRLSLLHGKVHSGRLPKEMAANQAPAARTDPIFEVAFRKLKGSVTEADAAVFQSTKFEDVWKAAEDIEKMHREKRSLMNMRRIEPFLKGLEGYSKVIEVLCNGTPYMPWIWVCLLSFGC